MITFSRWMENLSPAQHKVGEIDKNLDDVVAYRLVQLAIGMETEGKASRQDVLKSIERIIGTVNKQQGQQNQSNQMDPNMQNNQMDPNQMQQNNPVA